MTPTSQTMIGICGGYSRSLLTLVGLFCHSMTPTPQTMIGKKKNLKSTPHSDSIHIQCARDLTFEDFFFWVSASLVQLEARLPVQMTLALRGRCGTIQYRMFFYLKKSLTGSAWRASASANDVGTSWEMRHTCSKVEAMAAVKVTKLN